MLKKVRNYWCSRVHGSVIKVCFLLLSGAGKTLSEQLSDAKKQATEASTEMKSASLTIEHLGREIQRKSKNLKDTGGEVERLQKEHRTAQKECDKLKETISNLAYNDQKEAELMKVTIPRYGLSNNTFSHLSLFFCFVFCLFSGL